MERGIKPKLMSKPKGGKKDAVAKGVKGKLAAAGAAEGKEGDDEEEDEDDDEEEEEEDVGS
jgi:ribosomal protein L12E/L44/L45/RPP1/RPP2